MRQLHRNLPIDKYLDQIVESVRLNSQIILTATPGAGKTTRLPKYLLGAVQGKIAVLQPRRVAAISACQFVAEENSWAVGDQVGYQVRLDSKLSPHTRLIFMTDAILLRRLIDDPELSDFDMIVIDEFHERNLNQDLILALLKELQELGRDIKVMVMSATLELTELKAYLPSSQLIEIPGDVFPLEIIYSQQPLSLQTDDKFIARVSKSIVNEGAVKDTKDILVFLPGVGEINRLKNRLMDLNLGPEVLILHGSLDFESQKKVLSPSQRQRIILATNIAEASVTVPGVNVVIDTGLVKISSTHLSSGFSKLSLTSISKFNATQRAGRAARQSPGRCLRLWTVHEESSKPQQMPPEIVRSDLTASVLLLAFLGVTDPGTFSWFQKPPEVLLKKAKGFLIQNKAILATGEITGLGRRILTFPLEPRYALILLQGLGSLGDKLQNFEEQKNHIKDLCDLVALLQEPQSLQMDSRFESLSESDILDRIQRLNELAKIETNFKVRHIHEVSKQLQNIFKKHEQIKSDHDLNLNTKANSNEKNKQIEKQNPKSASEFKKLIDQIVKTQGDRLCRRRGTSDRGLMVGGRGVKLNSLSQVKKSEFFIAFQGHDLDHQSETIIDIAHGMSKAEVLELFKDQIRYADKVIYNTEKGQFESHKARRFQDLDLEDPIIAKVSADQLGNKWLDTLVLNWGEILKNHQPLSRWMNRWQFFKNSFQNTESNEAKPEHDSLTSEMIRQALEMASVGSHDMQSLLKQDLVYFLETQIDTELLKEFKKITPAQFHAPSGGVHPIVYSQDEAPYVEVRLQEVFGLTENPKIGRTHQALIFKLLAPNFRPVQVTSDIEGFWQRSYFEVRKQLRGRYPKHSWPEDPLSAIPVQKGKRR